MCLKEWSILEDKVEYEIPKQHRLWGEPENVTGSAKRGLIAFPDF